MELLVILVSWIAIGCAIGAAVSFIAWIPLIQRMGQRSPQARKRIVFGLGILAWILMISLWLLLLYVRAEATLIFSWTGVGDDFVDNKPYLIYDEEVLQNWDVIRHEIWLRFVLLPPLRGPCFTSHEIACRWADRLIENSTGWSGYLATSLEYLLGFVGIGLPAIISGASAWYATRQKRVATSEHETR